MLDLSNSLREVKDMRKKFVLILSIICVTIFTLTCLINAADTYSVSGRLINSSTNKPVKYKHSNTDATQTQ